MGGALTFLSGGRPALTQPSRDSGNPINVDQPTVNESRDQDVSAPGHGCSFRTQIRPRSGRSDHQMESSLIVGGQPIKSQSTIRRAAKWFIEEHLDCRHSEVGEGHHSMDRDARNGCRVW